jgi:hypothetical protein
LLRSLDNLVGELLKMQGHVEADRLGCLEIDDKFELNWRLHWKLARIRALENAIDIRRRTPKIIGSVNAVGQQAANFSEETEWIDGRETIASR